MGMRFRQRKVTEHKAQIVPHVTAHAMHDGLRAPAVRTLEIAILDERHRCVGGTEAVIALGDGDHQLR